MSDGVDGNIHILLGQLKGDMEEGQRQRSRLFQMVEGVSQAVARLSGQFEARSKSDDEWREETSRRLEELERRAAEHSALLGAVDAPAARPRRRRLSLSLVTVIGGSGGGIAALFFGSGLATLLGRGIEMIKKIHF